MSVSEVAEDNGPHRARKNGVSLSFFFSRTEEVLRKGANRKIEAMKKQIAKLQEEAHQRAEEKEKERLIVGRPSPRGF